MGISAWVCGTLGGLSAVMGICTAAGVVPLLGAEFTSMFWLVVSVILLLASIAFAVGRAGYE